MNRVYFITGATGFVGQNLIIKILKSDNQSKLVLLVRGDTVLDAKNRITKIITSISNEISKENQNINT